MNDEEDDLILLAGNSAPIMCRDRHFMAVLTKM